MGRRLRAKFQVLSEYYIGMFVANYKYKKCLEWYHKQSKYQINIIQVNVGMNE